MAKKVLVVRMGSETVHVVHMENTAQNPTIYGCVRIAAPEGAVQDGMIVDVAEAASKLKQVLKEKGLHTTDVIFTVASSKIASRETTIPSVSKSKIGALVMAKVPDLFPVDAERYIFSHVLQGKEYVDEEKKKVQDVRVFAAPAELIDSYYTLAEVAGLNIVAVEADGNSIFQIMRRQVQQGISMAVQINRASTVVNIISQEKLLLQRVIPYGINTFTEIMTQEPAFQTPDEESAFSLLTSRRVLLDSLNYENTAGDPTLEKRIAVTENASYLVGNIGRVMEYYNSKYKDRPIERIICTGQGCSVAGIHELLRNELGVEVSTPNVLTGVHFNRKIEIDAAILQYLNCFGAVFSPVGFVSRDVARKAARKGSLTASIVLFVVCLVSSGLLAGFSIYMLLTTTSDKEYWEKRYDALKSVQDEYNSLMQIESNHELLYLLDDVTDTNNNDFSQLIEKISDVCPKSFRIQSITSNETTISINAVSTERLLSLPALKMQLEKIPEIKNAKIDSIAEKKEALTKKKQYSYTLTFDFANAGAAVQEGGQ